MFCSRVLYTRETYSSRLEVGGEVRGHQNEIGFQFIIKSYKRYNTKALSNVI
jgi:hypothetical protein